MISDHELKVANGCLEYLAGIFPELDQKHIKAGKISEFIVATVEDIEDEGVSRLRILNFCSGRTLIKTLIGLSEYVPNEIRFTVAAKILAGKEGEDKQ